MISPDQLVKKFDNHFELFYDLMPNKVREILLISTPYDAFVLEEDGSLPHRIINEYRGLNLSAPPRLTRTSSLADALGLLAERHFDLVLTMPFVGCLDAHALNHAIKEKHHDLPVVLLASMSEVHNSNKSHKAASLFSPCAAAYDLSRTADRLYIWSGDANLLFALVKNIEDHANAPHDTEKAMVRVIILVEDDPAYLSKILPLLYKALVRQTHEVLDEGLNEEHRLLKMRARPKILIAADYESALELFEHYQKYVFAIISDTRFPKQGKLNDGAGLEFLRLVRRSFADLPLLLMSSDGANRQKSLAVTAGFLDKNHADLQRELDNFLLKDLGFGDFVFRRQDGREVGRAVDFADFEHQLANIMEESLLYHASRNHFSTWLMARSEIGLATELAKLEPGDFRDTATMRQYLVETVHAFRKWRQLGVVSTFDRREFDPEINDIVKIGQGEMGGKARGVAFLSHLLRQRLGSTDKGTTARIIIPHSCVIGADGFDEFVEQNKLFYLCGGQDHIIAKRFLAASLPHWLHDELAAYLAKTTMPLAVRSSSMLEDARYRPYAGLYKTCMLANNQRDFKIRLYELEQAVKMVYASVYFASPRAFSRSIGQSNPESMPVLIQQLAGRDYDGYFYPALSGVAQSHNYYPVSRMKPEDGIASLALGFGATVVKGERCLRFSPPYPQILPQFSNVDDILINSQRHLYVLDMCHERDSLTDGLTRLAIDDLAGNGPIAGLSSAYIPAEHRLRDVAVGGSRVITMAAILKYKTYPLSEILTEMLAMGSAGMGGAVEIEFAVDLDNRPGASTFYLLQIRPMAVDGFGDVKITAHDKKQAICVCNSTLGHGIVEVEDIIIVRDDTFSVSRTREIASEIGRLNAELTAKGRKYLLMGPGRWGSADSLLGIPVRWRDIAGVGAMVEILGESMAVDPSQGSHFFQNITSLGIPYLTMDLSDGGKAAGDKLDWQWLNSQTAEDGNYLRHISLAQAIEIKVDGKMGQGIILPFHNK